MSFRIDSMTTVKNIAIVFSNSLGPDQTRQSVWLALGLKVLNMCQVTRKLDSVPCECQIVITKQFGD